MHRSVSALAICLLAWGLAPVAVEAQQRDRCSDYANGMVSQDQRARQAKCPGWTSHSNYNNHYNWCQAQTPARVQQAISNWQTRFQACQFAASGSPVAQADGKRCDAYGDEMVRMDRNARAQQCRGWTGHSNRNNHVAWCMSQTAARANQALSNWRQRLRAC